MREHTIVIPKYFSNETIDNWNKQCEHIPSEPSYLYGKANNNVDTNIRESSTRWVRFNKHTRLHKSINSEVMLFVNNHIWQFGFDIYQTTYNIQHTTYVEGGHFIEHADTLPTVGKYAYDRKLTAIIMMSPKNSYTGGELYVKCGHTDIHMDMDKGGIALFPSYLKHRVEKVTSGVRQTLVCWIVGPLWR